MTFFRTSQEAWGQQGHTKEPKQASWQQRQLLQESSGFCRRIWRNPCRHDTSVKETTMLKDLACQLVFQANNEPVAEVQLQHRAEQSIQQKGGFFHPGYGNVLFQHIYAMLNCFFLSLPVHSPLCPMSLPPAPSSSLPVLPLFMSSASTSSLQPLYISPSVSISSLSSSVPVLTLTLRHKSNRAKVAVWQLPSN